MTNANPCATGPRRRGVALAAVVLPVLLGAGCGSEDGRRSEDHPAKASLDLDGVVRRATEAMHDGRRPSAVLGPEALAALRRGIPWTGDVVADLDEHAERIRWTRERLAQEEKAPTVDGPRLEEHLGWLRHLVRALERGDTKTAELGMATLRRVEEARR